MQARDILIYLSIKYDGNYLDIMEAIKQKQTFDEQEAEKTLKEKDFNAITILDREYPASWKNCVRPPLVVFYRGDFSLIKDENKCVSYVGSRIASPYGLKMANYFAGGLAKNGFVVVSGLARGIDSEATKAALEAGGKAVAILGSGVDFCYPSSSSDLYEKLKSTGLILSEYPFKTEPKQQNFPERNRIIAATSHLLVVGESGQKSGTLITVSFALSFNKDIACVPFPACENSSCNTLIRDGAYLIDSLSDLLYLAGGRSSE